MQRRSCMWTRSIKSTVFFGLKLIWNGLRQSGKLCLICSHADDIFFRGGLAYFMLNHILQLLQQYGFVVEESWCWTGLAAVQSFHQLKTLWALLNVKKTPKKSLDSQTLTDRCGKLCFFLILAHLICFGWLKKWVYEICKWLHSLFIYNFFLELDLYVFNLQMQCGDIRVS